ncbi:MAG: hypothetical protein HY909_14180 [Deltaproteobacteria bacterium]|nr:hypothetical protein [Deltaproteobacteria bacterium]
MSKDAHLEAYRAWLGAHIQDVLARPALHAATPYEAELTLVTLLEAWVGAWSVARGRTPERDIARVTAAWRAACHRAGVAPGEPSRLHGRDQGWSAVTALRWTSGMGRVWEDVQAMCP